MTFEWLNPGDVAIPTKVLLNAYQGTRCRGIVDVNLIQAKNVIELNIVQLCYIHQGLLSI